MKLTLAFFGLALSLYGQTTIDIDTGKRAAYRIPRTIFGTFLEPIGNAVYNGLWAEILQNPSFEENLWSVANVRRMTESEPALLRSSQMGLPLPWEPLDYSQGSRYEPRWNEATNSSRSLLVMALPGKQTGIRQRIFLPVHRTLSYSGSLYVKHVSGPAKAEISVRRRNHPEKIFAREVLDLTRSDWKRYRFECNCKRINSTPLEPADFVIALSDETRALIDQASLMPADNVDGMDPEMVRLSARFENTSRSFRWKLHFRLSLAGWCGPRDKRVSMLNISWASRSTTRSGPTNFSDFVN